MGDFLSNFWGVIPTIISIVLAVRLVTKDTSKRDIDVSNMGVKLDNLEKRIDAMEVNNKEELNKIYIKLDSIFDILMRSIKN